MLSELPAQPLSLQDCRRMALEHNERMQMADNAVRKAELDRQIAFAQYLPKADGQLTGIYMKDQERLGVALQTRGAYMAGLNITLPLYTGGQITAANKLSKIGKTISEEQRRQAWAEIISGVDNAYYQLVAVRSKVELLEAYVRQMQGLYDQVKLSVTAQMATDADLLRISSKQSEVSYHLQKARNGEELCRLALANAMGSDLTTTIVPTDTFTYAALLSQPLTEDLAERPEFQLLQQQVKACEQQVKMARSNYLPSVALTGGYSYMGNMKLKGELTVSDEYQTITKGLGLGNTFPIDEKLDGGGTMAMLSVSVPLFHWGAELKKVKKAKLDAENARLELQQNKRMMHIEVRQAVQNLTSSQLMLETAIIGQQQAEENLRVMRQKYNAQMATMTDLLDAQSQWQQARSNLIESQTQQKIYETEYLRVTGRLE